MLTNPGTPFDKDGWADMVSDIRRLWLQLNGGANDTNNATQEVSQVPDQFKPITVRVCVDGIEKTMRVMGTDPV